MWSKYSIPIQNTVSEAHAGIKHKRSQKIERPCDLPENNFTRNLAN